MKNFTANGKLWIGIFEFILTIRDKEVKDGRQDVKKESFTSH